MSKLLSFDDVLLEPNFSTVKSRKDVNTKFNFLGEDIFPVISSNMDSVTGSKMATAMLDYGARGALHRFMSIEDNVKEFNNVKGNAYVSLGLGDKELERAAALFNAGATHFIIDVAHGASAEVVRQTKALQYILKQNASIVVGNFATAQTIKDFLHHLGNKDVGAFKIGIGGGSACSTRLVTGIGVSTFHSIVDCSTIGVRIIADGGISNSGDFCKALAAGASAVMVGRLLAGCDESAAKTIKTKYSHSKQYKGSASAASYDVQGKFANHRTEEGESFLVPYSGTVEKTLQKLEAGLRSSMSYLGSSNLTEFKENAKFNEITNAGILESKVNARNF